MKKARFSREAMGEEQRCLFSRDESNFVESGLETGIDFHWPLTRGGNRLLTINVLGYHEVSSMHVAVITPVGEVLLG